jgi:hypothetical protein
MITIYRYYAALHGLRKVPAYSAQCRSILAKMGAVAKLQTPLLAQTTTDLNLLDAAEQLAHKGSPAATADRNAKLRVVQSDMRQLKAFIQSVADSDLLNAQALIESSGMSVAKKAVRTKPEIAAKPGKVTTTATVHAKAVKGRASYQWQMSTDQKAWLDLPATVKATTSVSSLTPATTYYFRFRSLTAAGLSDWSTVASLIAH